eukprot:augustus_masked-scaffold_1-processed-gene-15.9-mRNA-1 protein AED:0.15 eAED:0.19 QI:0/-1/0/1/-1/1/1/0/954
MYKIMDTKREQNLVCFVGDKLDEKGKTLPLENDFFDNSPRKKNNIHTFVVDTGLTVSLNGVQAADRNVLKVSGRYFDTKIFTETKYKIRNVLCAPIRLNENVIGVIRVMNKGGGSGFNELDEQILNAVSSQMSSIITSKMFSHKYEELKPITDVSESIPLKVQVDRYYGSVKKNEGSQQFEFNKEETIVEVDVSVYHGSEKLGYNEPVSNVARLKLTTSGNVNIADSRDGALENLVTVPIDIKHLPRTAILVFQVFATSEKLGRLPVGWTAFNLFNFEQVLRVSESVSRKLCLYPNSLELLPEELEKDLWFNSQTYGNTRVVGVIEVKILHPFNLEARKHKLIYTDNDDYAKYKKRQHSILIKDLDTRNQKKKQPRKELFKDEVRRIRSMLPLTKLEKQDSYVLQQANVVQMIKNDVMMLSRYVESTFTGDPTRQKIMTMYAHLTEWEKVDHLSAVQLIGPGFSDPKVRALAVQAFHGLPDKELSSFIIQLIQALKYEVFIDNPLACLLICRSIQNCRLIGVQVYWALTAELDNTHESNPMSKRYKFYRQLIYQNLPNRLEINNQDRILKLLKRIHLQLRENFDKGRAKGKTEKTKLLKKALEKSVERSEWPSKFSLPINFEKKNSSSRVKTDAVEMTWFNGILWKESSVMSSKKLPFKLTFQNADPNGENLEVLFKVGDDLRQDQLTLQVISVMDSLWRQHKLDLKLSIYKVVAVSRDVGFIEVVKNSKTLAKLQVGETKKGGFLGPIKGAWEAIRSEKFLREWNVSSRAERNTADLIRENFITSCAGYCVLTYVLGIGDRHNDNIMMTSDLKLFHIDFGHFLGNFKKKFGVKREKAPFVLTGPMLQVINANKCMEPFEETCLSAFRVLRDPKNTKSLIMLFYLMLSSRIPELEKQSDLRWLDRKLCPELNSSEADQHFRSLINEAARSATTQFNHFTHIVKHYKNYFDKPSV